MPDTAEWHPDDLQLVAFDSGNLPGAEWARVEDHIARCVNCCQRLERMPTDSLCAMLRATGAPAAPFAAGPGAGASTPTNASATTLVPDAPEELLQHPRYRILGLLGAGGMGMVFKAEHRLMERVVALKVMRKDLLNPPPSAVTQFRQEVRMAARLGHPNIVTAYDADQAGDIHFLVMEFVPGSTLEEIVAACGPLPVAEACDAIRQAALGLQHAFEKGMVHRDIKPQNLLRTPDGVVKILDFGLARFALTLTSAPGNGPEAGGTQRVGFLMGTPDYIAPEQALAPHKADTRADIYSLGCSLYYLLTGRVPFPAGNAEQKAAAHIHQTAPSVAAARKDLPPGLADVIGRTLAKNPANRYQTSAHLAHALEGFIPALGSGQRATRPLSVRKTVGPRRRWSWLAVGLAVAVSVVLGFALRPNGAQEQAGSPGELKNDRTAAAAPTSTPLAWPLTPVEPPTPPVEPPATPIEAPPPKITPPPAAVEPMPRPADMHAQVVAWLKDKNRFGPDHAFVGQHADMVARQLTKGKGFELSIGGGLLKSGKPTLLTTRGGQLFVFEYTDAQVKACKLKDRSIIFKETIDHRGPIRATPDVELSDLRIDGADEIDPIKRVTGKVAYRVLGQSNGNLALRIVRCPGKKPQTGIIYLDGDTLSKKSGTLSFSIAEFADAGGVSAAAIPVFVEMIAMAEPRRPDKATVISNILVTIVTIAPGTVP